MIKTMLILFVFWCAALLQGCGQAANDPYRVIGSTETLPTIIIPFATTTGQWSTFNPFDLSARDGMEFNYVNFSTAINLIAPASGLVSSIEGTSVTIYHNARMSTKVTGFSVIGVRVGDFVNQGSILGTAGQSNTTFTATIRLSVNLDGVFTCPMSFFATDSLRYINSLSAPFSGFNVPCR